MSKFEDNEEFELEEINTKSSPPNFGNEITTEKHGSSGTDLMWCAPLPGRSKVQNR